MVRKKASNSRVRLNLALSPRVMERMERILKMSEAENPTQVIRYALAHYEELLSLNQNGGKVILQEKNGNQSILRVL